MKKSTFISLAAIVFSLGLGSCSGTSKEEKAFEAAVQSRQISQLRQFVTDFPEATELLDSAQNILSEWVSDSTDFVTIKATADIVERYDLETNYALAHPEGLYLDSVNAMLAADTSEAEAIKAHREAVAEHLEKYRKEIEDIVYYSDNGDGSRFFFYMIPPDSEGKGIGLLGDVGKGWKDFEDNYPGGKFSYEINIEDFEDDVIICRTKKNTFNIEIYDKSLHITSKGSYYSLIGERDPETYKACIKILNGSN